jgi:UDP:flavonoid glycosyltransferase YjiC (YdhE family)
MRILVASWAGRSHYFATVPLAWAARLAGHEVRVAGQPGFAATVTASGLPMSAVGTDVDVSALLRANLGRKVNSTAELPTRWPAGSPEATLLARVRRGLGHFVTLADVMVDDMLALARAWRPDLVLFEPTTFAAPVVATALGIPSVRHLWAPDFTADLPSVEADLLAPVLERHGLTRCGINGDVTVDPCPPELQLPHLTGHLGMRYVPYNGGGVVPALPPRGARPRVCVTFGMSQTELSIGGGVDLPALLRAAAELPVEVVVPGGAARRAAFGALPATVVLLDPVPLQALLATCDAVVHHGGSGTLMTAMSCGVPQLVVPNMPDLAFNARRLAATGAGRARPADTADPATLAADIDALLTDPSYRAAAARLRAQSSAQPGPAEVVAQLESLVSA